MLPKTFSANCYSSCYGITKYLSESDYMLVYRYRVLDNNLSETFGEVIWKYNIDELIDKLLDSLNELINKSYSKTTEFELTNELLGTLKIIENCTNFKDNNTEKFYLELINVIERFLAELEKKEQKEKSNIIHKLNNELFETNNRLNKKLLCEGCRGKKLKS